MKLLWIKELLFTGGELLLNENAWVADYGPEDVILF